MELLWYIPNQVTAGHRSDTRWRVTTASSA